MPLPPPSPAAPPAPLPDGIVEELRREALAIGFSRMGVAAVAARDPAVHAAFRAWLERGLAGPMTDWLVGHEALRRHPEGMLPGVRTVVMLATDHAPAEAAAAAPGHGRVAAYARGDDYHPLLRRRVNRLGAWLEARLPGCRTRGVVDSAPFSEREFGWLAGLGWFGKNCMLIDPAAGSCFLLAGLLTDLELPASEPIRVDHCGTCTACLDACPTQAFPAPHVLDAGRCISTLTIEQRGAVAGPLRAGLGEWIFGCDVCQEVCPWNRRAPGTAEPALLPRGDAAATALVEILALDEAGFRARYRGSAILRAKCAGLARSAAIALGNHPDPAAAAALAAALDDDEAVVRGAAAWALGCWLEARVGEPAALAAALEARLGREAEGEVRREIAAALSRRP
ncbi:MAG: tRNA epoxyqueuosine(34) reductase QueG [Planctomycetaceae bacterium]